MKSTTQQNGNAFFSAAIDICYQPAKLAIARKSKEDGEILDLHKDFTDSITSGYSLLQWIANALRKISISMNQINEWTIGTGPGHFSQLRMLSATMLGSTFRQNVKIRGIPSGAALSSLIPEKSAKFFVPYQLHKSIFVLTLFHKIDPTHCVLLRYETIHSQNEIWSNINPEEKIIICQEHNITPSSLGNTIFFKGKEYPVETLLSLNPENWDKKSAKNLLYGRSPAKSPN